jgi:1-acyl-sn-glycerol-3-phosphate acyltransferase
MAFFVSLSRQAAGMLLLALLVPLFAVGCLVLLPSRVLRIRLCNVFGHICGRAVLAICGATVVGNPSGTEAAFPAIYVSNHTSPLDIFLGIWLAPHRTVGVAKKEVIFYPLFGQLYFLSGHLRLDRKDHASAVAALAEVAAMIKKHGLGLWLWPEGTRSKDGRLGPFKKGFVHMALATRLPVVPVVVSGAHRGWKKGSFTIESCTMNVQVLPPIPTDRWRLETLDEHVAAVRGAFLSHLPEDQRERVA